MAIGDTIRDFLANTIHDNSGAVLLVAAGAVAVALALSLIARVAFWVLGILGTVGAGWILVNGGFATSTLTLAGLVLAGGWVGGFLVRGMIKVGSILVTLFGYGLFWLVGWSSGNNTNGGSDVFWYDWSLIMHGILAAVLVVAVLVLPGLLAKLGVGAVKAVVPGGGEKKDKQPAEIKR